VDNFGAGFSAFNLETPSFSPQAIMATNELAVAAALWDLTDATDEASFDFLSGNETEVWEAVDLEMPGMLQLTLEDFRAGLEIVAPALLPSFTGSESDLRILNAREIRYYPDGSEPNGPGDPAPALVAGGPGALTRTVFGAGDEDWFSVDLPSGGRLDAQTLNLGDGGDTVLDLFAPDRTTLLATNDNRQPGDASSRIRAPLPLPGLYYLRVRGVGPVVEHGYYDLEVQVLPLKGNGPPEAGYCSGTVGSGGPAPAAALAAFLLLGWLPCFRRR
jgi:hypothetical protein